MGRAKIGLEGKLYYNTGSFDVPTWVEVKCRDLDLGDSKAEGDISHRGSGIKLSRGTLKEISVEFQMRVKSGDTVLAAFRAAYDAGTPIDCAVLDGSIEEAGNWGYRGPWEVLGFDRHEPMEEGMMLDLTLKPTEDDDDNVVDEYETE